MNVNVSVIKYVMLESIKIIKIINAGKELIDKLVEECSENIDGNEMIYNSTLNAIPLNGCRKVCNLCTV